MVGRAAGIALALLVTGAVVLPASASTLPPEAPAPSLTVEDPACTITGTRGPDRLMGTPGDDVICGLGGNDVLAGLGGNDVLVGGPGRDRASGGSGSDDLRGGTGADSLSGGPGSDAISGGEGRDDVDGGPGADACAPDAADSSTNCVADSSGPSITIVSAPGSVRPGDELTFRWQVTDPARAQTTWLFIGGRQGWLPWCMDSPSFEGVQESGDQFDGVYSLTCQVPRDVINDQFSIWIGAIDALGNVTPLSERGEFTVSGGSDDLSAPVISIVAIPESATPGGSITIAWTVTDESPIRFTTVFLRGPDFSTLGDFTSTLVDEATGTYQATIQIPQDAAIGTYTVWEWSGDIVNNRSVGVVGSVQVG